MKAIKSFLVALIIFVLFILSAHMLISGKSLKVNGDKFGFWFNSYKNSSYNGIVQNMKDDTVLLMGSSELRYGRDSIYHPKNLFNGQDMSIMAVGAAFNASLWHTICLGSIEPNLKSKKVILMISPTWFKKDGIRSNAYALRFSYMQYMAFMENPNIPEDIKEYVALRSEHLLKDDSNKLKNVRNINNINLKSRKAGIRSLYAMSKLYEVDKEYITLKSAITFGKHSLIGETPGSGVPAVKNLEWEKLQSMANEKAKKQSGNVFYMRDKLWKRKIRKLFKAGLAGMHRRESYETSPEYADLEAFLQVCKSRGIRADLIILPVNGKYYDYTGMTKEKRAVVGTKVAKLAAKYGARCDNLSKHDYDRYITEDAVHPWGKGWLYIDEVIYDFYFRGSKGEALTAKLAEMRENYGRVG